MNYRTDKGAHSVYALHFHLVQTTKYRRKVLTGDVDDFLKRYTQEVFERFGLEIIEQETDLDHIHILFSSKPSVTISKVINSFKSVTSRQLRLRFPALKKSVRHDVFWSKSYFLASVGQVTLEDIRHYVQTQKD